MYEWAQTFSISELSQLITAVAAVVGAVAATKAARRTKKNLEQTNGVVQRIEDMARAAGYEVGLDKGRHESDYNSR